MKNFFHLSKSRSAKAIVASSDARAQDPSLYFSPRKPRDHCDETPDGRICVAPHVWQCLLSILEVETPPIFIYSVKCSGAIQASKEEHGVGDAEITHEHWIVEEVVAQNGGSIRLSCEGFLNETIRYKFLIRKWMNEQKGQSLDPNTLDEREHLWIVDEATVPMEWRLRLCTSIEIIDDSPLILPPTWP
jgi:hypothetical protein